MAGPDSGPVEKSAKVDVQPKIPAKPPETVKPKIDRRDTVDLLYAAERDAIIVGHLERHLAPLGFTPIKPWHWVDGSSAPARRVFDLMLLRGASMQPNWGFSLDFVPHLSAGKIRWHRSDRTAKLDVYVDPRAHDNASYLFGAQRLDRDLERLVPTAVAQAQETWRRGSTWSGMLGIVHDIRDQKSNRFPFHFYVQLPLALMFLSAKAGDLAAAHAELETYAERKKIADDIVVRLRKLIDECSLSGS